jgi:hypothetical protein
MGAPNANIITIRLAHKNFLVSREAWTINRLKLDPANPRLGYQLRGIGAAASDAELHDMLWDLDSVKSLYQSVKQNGGLIEDPIVHSDGKVAEGNCRTVVLRELHMNYPDDPQWQHVYVRVLPKHVTEEEIMLLLGELHIAGKIEWRAFDQAEYVWRMNKVYGKTYDHLSNHLRWSRAKLAQKIGAFEETKTYLARTNDPQGINRFSHFEEFMKKKELRDLREKDPRFMERFRQWVFEGRFPDAKDVRDLPSILENQEAFDVMEKHGIQKARTILYAENPALTSNLYSAVDRAILELEGIAIIEIKALQNGDDVRLEKLRRLQKALDSVKQRVGAKLD